MKKVLFHPHGVRLPLPSGNTGERNRFAVAGYHAVVIDAVIFHFVYTAYATFVK